MSGVWFTSDLHLGHEFIAKDRGFATVEEHDEAVLQSLRSIPTTGKVKPELWILGDLTSGTGSALAYALPLLRDLVRDDGVENSRVRKLHLIPGNHDPCHPANSRASHRQLPLFGMFESVQLFARRRIGGERVLLSHFPYRGDHTPVDRYREFRLQDEGAFLLHGHTHSHLVQTGRQIHVGWDAWRRPVEIGEVAGMIALQDVGLQKLTADDARKSFGFKG